MGSSVTAMGMVSESKFHVLAVDDSLIDRKLIEMLLKTSSYQVTTVDSGSKALEFLGLRGDDPSNSTPSVSSINHHQEVAVNLVITDYCMPGMTGYDLLKKIKGSKALRNIPVVIMSSENVPSRINRCLEEGAEEFFLKPVKISDVTRLRPHILKTKVRDGKEEKTEEEDDKPVSGSQSLSIEQQQLEQEPEQLRLLPPLPAPLHDGDELQLLPPLPTPPQQSNNNKRKAMEEGLSPDRTTPPQQSNNNKRKAMEEGLSPDRTRPRYNGITTMV